MQINEQAIQDTAAFAYAVASWLSEDKEGSDRFCDYSLTQANGAGWSATPDQYMAIHEQHISALVRALHNAQAILHIVAFDPPPPDFQSLIAALPPIQMSVHEYRDENDGEDV